jgi:glycosyltransferase involved in cell wall biosynthesis
MNLAAIWARRLSGAQTKVVASERVGYPHFLGADRRHKWRWRYLAPLLARNYPRADGIVAVSEGVADELAHYTGLARERISVIYNPVVTPAVYERAREPVTHPWFVERDRPVILGVGRLADMKDFSTLLRAFARLRAGRAARLVILGEGKRRRALEALVKELGVAEDVDLPGWAGNPYPFMANADLFALSSRGEGLPNALLEAMAVGCPVVSTDCPSGPREILDGGRYGPLVAVGDDAGLARAMAETLDAPPARNVLMERAAMFSQERSADAHLALFRRILERDGKRLAAE